MDSVFEVHGFLQQCLVKLIFNSNWVHSQIFHRYLVNFYGVDKSDWFMLTQCYNARSPSVVVPSLIEAMVKDHLFLRGLVEEEIDIKASNLGRTWNR